MRRLALCLAVVAAAGCGRRPATRAPAATGTDPLARATQLVVGIADDWQATHAVLTRYDRDGTTWRPVGDPIAAVIGKSGLAWGRGLHGDGPPAGRTGPIKAEGDGRAPAGAFALVAAFGDGATAPGELPYHALDDAWRCVDDPHSTHYNTVLDSRGVQVDWSSAETMHRPDGLYRLGVIVDHNPAARRGAGSCIFLHIWRGPDAPTVGCTAMAPASIEALVAWLRPGAVYVLLPRAEYRALAAAWRLPTAPGDR